MPALVFYNDEWEHNGYAAAHPDMKIETGCVVKLRNPLRESFFVIVQHRHPTNEEKWVGKVDNHLINGSEYNFGDMVLFTEEDVYDFKSLEVVEQQKKNRPLIIALRLMVTYLEEMGVIREDMSREQRIEITDYFIMEYPHKLEAMLELVRELSTPEEEEEERDDGGDGGERDE